MLGTKLYKNNKSDIANYTKTAVWCNANNAHIEDASEYYEVVANPEQTSTKENLDYEYNSRVYELQKYMSIAMLRNDTDLIAELQAEFADLQNAYNEALAELN